MEIASGTLIRFGERFRSSLRPPTGPSWWLVKMFRINYGVSVGVVASVSQLAIAFRIGPYVTIIDCDFSRPLRPRTVAPPARAGGDRRRCVDRLRKGLCVAGRTRIGPRRGFVAMHAVVNRDCRALHRGRRGTSKEDQRSRPEKRF